MCRLIVSFVLCIGSTRVERQAMHKAAAMGQGACIKKLIEGKADLRAADLEGNTALHLAAQSGFGPVRLELQLVF